MGFRSPTRFLTTCGVVAVLVAGSSTVASPSAGADSAVSSKTMKRISSMKFSGGCTNNRGYPGQVVMEEKYDPTCRVTVSLTGSSERVVALQYWDEDDQEWYVESKKKSTKRKATLSFKPRNCGDNGDEYCDGTYEYRVYVMPSTKPKLSAIKSTSFEVKFISLDGGDDYECDPDYEDC